MQPYFETPPKMTVSITNTCNLDCAHCYGDCTPTRSPRELTVTEWLQFIDYLVDNDFIELYIEGGEPLVMPGFDAVLAHCARKLMTMVRTNGTLLTDEVAQRWKAHGVGRVFVDIMGATASHRTTRWPAWPEASKNPVALCADFIRPAFRSTC